MADHFMQKMAARSGKRVTKMSKEVRQLLRQHVWPGNIRELENVIEAAVHFANGDTITLEALPEYLKANQTYPLEGKTLKEMLEDAEKAVIQQSLQHHQDKLKAAKALGISKSALYEKIKKYGLG
nr:helix-turn-helix domain-containing protein [Anoxybacillus sp.]